MEIKNIDKPNILFLYGSSKLDSTAYSFRLNKFKDFFSRNQFLVDSVYLGDCKLKVPFALQPLNIPYTIQEIRDTDIVHAGGTPCAYFMNLCSKLSHTRFIYDVHGDIVQEFIMGYNKYNLTDNYNLFQAKIMEYFASRSDYFIACSGPLKQHYINLGVESNQIEIIRNGVDLDLFKPEECKFENSKFVVTYAGGFQKWQGIENLIASAKKIDSEDIIFRIIGFSNSNQMLKKQIKLELKDKVELIDTLPRKELLKYLANSDILIIPRNNHPAINAALPTKFAEYAAMGKPIIVTDVDETAHLVKKYNCGFVCNPNVDSIISTISTAMSISTKELIEKGTNARKLAEIEFNQEKINEKYHDFVCSILTE